MDAYGKRDMREGARKRTVRQVFGDGLSLAHEVDAEVSWIVLRLPAPAPEKVVRDQLVVKIEDTVGTGHRGIKGGRLLIVYIMQRKSLIEPRMRRL